MKREEWDFSGLPDAELDACFYYEFARSADVIKNGVTAWRKSFLKLATVKIAWFNAPTDSWLPGTIRHSDDAEFEKYTAAMIDDDAANAVKPKSLSHIDARMLDFVSAFDEFPNKPWQLIKDSPIKQKFAKEWKVPDSNDPNLCLTDLTANLSVWHGMNLSALEMIQAAEHHPSNRQIRLTHHVFGFSWNYRNKELVAAFEAWLNTNRPAHFPEQTHAKSVTGFGWQRFPFRKENALGWLGVLRRRKSVKTWREYFQRYNPNALNQMGRNALGSKRMADIARPREEDCRKAKLILDWFSTGKVLKKEVFK